LLDAKGCKPQPKASLILVQAYFDVSVDRKPLGRIVIEASSCAAASVGRPSCAVRRGPSQATAARSSSHLPLHPRHISNLNLRETLPLPCRVQVAPSSPAIGGQRFLDLAQGKEGVALRKTKFELIEDGFVQNSGLKALSYQASGRTAITGELRACLCLICATQGVPTGAAPLVGQECRLALRDSRQRQFGSC
jgi:hypothetical protein